jgi:tetratricopeptide (TPR) repeat protein
MIYPMSSGDEDSELAILEFQLGHYEEACRLLKASLEKLASQGDESAHAHWLVAVSLERVEKHSDALQHLITANRMTEGAYVTDQKRVEEKLLFSMGGIGADKDEVEK